MPGESGGICPGVGRADRFDRDPVEAVGLLPAAIGWSIADNPGTAALTRLCREAVDELDLSGACVTVLTGSGAEIVAAAGDPGASLEELQFVLGEGPTPDAFVAGQPVLVPDLSWSRSRWLQFTAAAQARGVGAVYAFPLQLGGVRLGVSTFYAQAGPSPDSHRLAELLTRVDALREVLLDSLDGDHGFSGDLSGAVPLRTEVYQAQGMLMVALRISLRDALVRLRGMAYAEDLDINQLAAELVSGRRPMPTTGDGAE